MYEYVNIWILTKCASVQKNATHKEESAHGLGGGQQSADALLDLFPGVSGAVPAWPSRRHDNRAEHDVVAVATPQQESRL